MLHIKAHHKIFWDTLLSSPCKISVENFKKEGSNPLTGIRGGSHSTNYASISLDTLYYKPSNQVKKPWSLVPYVKTTPPIFSLLFWWIWLVEAHFCYFLCVICHFLTRFATLTAFHRSHFCFCHPLWISDKQRGHNQTLPFVQGPPIRSVLLNLGFLDQFFQPYASFSRSNILL